MNLDEVFGEKGLEKILREEKWRVEKMMKLKRNGVEKKMVKVGEDEWSLSATFSNFEEKSTDFKT